MNLTNMEELKDSKLSRHQKSEAKNPSQLIGQVTFALMVSG